MVPRMRHKAADYPIVSLVTLNTKQMAAGANEDSPLGQGGRGKHGFAEWVLAQNFELAASLKDGGRPFFVHKVELAIGGNRRGGEGAAEPVLPNAPACRKLQAGRDALIVYEIVQAIKENGGRDKRGPARGTP